MTTRFSTLLAVLFVAGLLGWMALKAPAPVQAVARAEPQERSGGSEVPCAVPLTWRVARVDPEFDLSVTEATRIVEEGAALWESASGRELFALDTEDGFPVRLVYDERQAALLEREQREQVLADVGNRLESEQAALLARSARFNAATAAHARRATDLARRVSEHNENVRRMNEQGGVPATRGLELEAVGDALGEERDEVEAERPALDSERASLLAAEEDLNERILQHQQLTEEINEVFPPSAVEAGEYREVVERVNGRVTSVGREIRLYQFAGPADLRMLAAHEFGHALGVGHSEDPAGVMNASARGDEPIASLADTDVALFSEVCPAG